MTNYKLCVLCYGFVYIIWMVCMWERESEKEFVFCGAWSMQWLSIWYHAAIWLMCIRVSACLLFDNSKPVWLSLCRSHCLVMCKDQLDPSYICWFPLSQRDIVLSSVLFCSFLRIILASNYIPNRKTHRIRSTKCQGYCEYTQNTASSCNFLHLFALLHAIDVDKLLDFLVDYMCTLPQLIETGKWKSM